MQRSLAFYSWAFRVTLLMVAAILLVLVSATSVRAQTVARTCSDFDSQAQAQAALDANPTNNDLVQNLDPDGDDEACEDFDFSDNQNGSSNDNDGASASAGNAQANGAAVVELTCEQLITIDEGADDGQYGGARGQYADDANLIAELRQKCEGKASADVIAGSIPGGTLADTGGPSLVYGALALGLILVGGGTLLLRSINR